MNRENHRAANARQLLAELRETLSGVHRVRVMIYANPDPDALASALAFKVMFETDRREVLIGYTGAVGRPENASMIRHLDIPAKPVSEEEAADAEIIVVVDAQPQFFKDFVLPRCDIVIDHHPVHLEDDVHFRDIRPQYMATSSIMTEYMRAAGTRLTRRLASALFYGIKTDSRHFMTDMSPGDVEAVKWLRTKADRDIVSSIEFSQFSRDSLDYFSIALVRRRFVRGVMFSHLGPVPAFDVCVQVADFLIRVEHVEWALVTGVVADTLVVVFRNDGLKKEAGHLARTAFDHVGSAGGHKSMGRAEIRQSGLPKGLLLTDNTGIEVFVLESLAKVDPTFLPILRLVKSGRHV
ncbi:MAG: DHH family phosphoesterase [Nitrospirae bacterium]|nr:DHH family phosphoesterase [Nitrospirota bacterium]MBI5694328.1 DHH family phosphoesterase [Nitrospirota bacterium]